MSPTNDILFEYPHELPAGTTPGTPVYTRLPGYYAVHGPRSDTAVPAPVLSFDEGPIAVMPGSPEQEGAAPEKISPVYSLQPTGTFAVPTGRVFIRFAEGISVPDRAEEIRKAGYKVAQRLEYAPNAAWLRAASGSIADALNKIDALSTVPGVENVEPQMLMQGARR
jgi:hypothetical protein